jgi:biotin carboxyl carrier protein
MNLSFWLNDKEHKLSLKEKAKNRIQVSLGKKKFDVTVEVLNKDEILLNIDGKVYNTIICSNTTAYSICVNGKSFDIERKSASQILSGSAAKKQRRDVKTSMPGKIVEILLDEGTEVDEGQAVLILEAMKMQNEIKSPQSGKITRISPKPGDSVETGALLFTVE